MKELAAGALILSVGIAISYFLAINGEPQSVWVWELFIDLPE